MKKLAAILLILVMTTCVAQAEWIDFYRSGENDVPDYLNARLEIQPCPELPVDAFTVFYEEDKCLLLPRLQTGEPPCLYDVSAGTVTPLTALPQDDAIWLGMLDEDGINLTDDEKSALIEDAGAMGAYFAVLGNSGLYRTACVSGSYILVSSICHLYIVDTENAVIRPTDGFILTDDGAVVSWEKPDSQYTITAFDGSQITGCFEGDPGYEMDLRSIDVTANSAACVVCNTNMDREEANPYAVGVRDGFEGAGSTTFVNIGGYRAIMSPDKVLVCGENNVIAFSEAAAAYIPTVLVRRDDGKAYALYSDEVAIYSLPIEQCTNAEGFTVLPEGKYGLFPLGVSDDGRYLAANEFITGDVVVIDLETLESNVLLDAETVHQMGVASPMVVVSNWDGSDCINTQGGYTLKFVFE